MSLVEFIGMLIAFSAFLILSIQRQREEHRRREHPEEFREEKEAEARAYKELLQSLDLPVPPELREEEEEAVAPHPPRVVPAQRVQRSVPAPRRTVRKFQFKAPLDSRKTGSRIENRRLNDAIAARQQRFRTTVVNEQLQLESTEVDPYAFQEEIGPPRSQKLLAQLKAPIQMVLFHEILSKPKASQPMGHLRGLPWEG